MNESKETFQNNASGFYEVTKRSDWIGPFIINIILIIITLYILMSMIYYGIKTKKWQTSDGSHVDKLNAGLVYTFLIFCALMCLFRYIVSLVHMNIGFGEEEQWLCETVADCAFVAYSMVLWSVFMFLWLRQRAFYTNRMLSIGTTKLIRFLSFGSIVLITFAGFGYMLYFTIPKNYVSSPMGCMYAADDNLRLGYGIYATATIFLAQIMLLFLFIYPVCRIHRSKQAKKNSIGLNLKTLEESEPKNHVSTNLFADSPDQNNKSEENFDRLNRNCKSSSFSVKPSSTGIRNILIKTLVFALLSTTLDVLLQLFTKYLLDDFNEHRRFNIILFDIAAFFNLLFLVFSFVTAKKILFSFFIDTESFKYCFA